MKPNGLQGFDGKGLGRLGGTPLVGESPAFLNLLLAVERIAAHAATTVLILGETGTGKELIARAIHYLGSRRDRPFVPINCGALPESLAENELFGHRVGAFTGASQASIGLVRCAHGGTLFLDEVDALPMRVQVSLLRFLQDGCFRPLGAMAEERVDVRIVAASNRSLEAEVRAGRFRQDLYYRLELFTLNVPPLRERAGDVRVLTNYFLQQCARHYRMPLKPLHERSAQWFEQYGWPGNVRQLENLIQREYLLSDDDELHIEAPADSAVPASPQARDPASLDNLTYHCAKQRVLQEFDRAYLTRLIERTQGNVTQAARLAGKERRAFGKLLKRYGIAAVRDGRDGAPL